VQLALLPQENSIFGIVTETYDLLRSPDVGESRWIRGAVTLPIQHCLVVRRGKTLHDIKKVLSHEQVRIFIFILGPYNTRILTLRPGPGTMSTVPRYASTRGTTS
jgi:hypothetical protein